jgi:exopolysaccharide production protein ExoQ
LDNILIKSLIRQSPVALGLGFAGLFAPALGLFAPKATVLLFAIAACTCLYVYIKQPDKHPSFPGPFNSSILALAVYAVASLLWSVSFDASWPLARSLPFSLLGGVLIIHSIRKLDEDGHSFIARATLTGFLLGALLTFFELLSGFAISHAIDIVKFGGDWNGDMLGFVISIGITLLVMMMFPVCLIFWKRGQPALAITALLFTMIMAGMSTNFAAIVAIIIGCLVFLTAYYLPNQIHKITIVITTLLILGMPFAMQVLPDARTIGKNLPELSFSVYPRLVIWQYAANRTMESPILGHGIRTSRAMDIEQARISFLYRDNGKVKKGNTKAIPLHPHNGVIQMWLELGGLGALIGLAIILSVLRGIHKSMVSPIHKAFLYAALFSSMCLMSVSYGLWQNWWIGALWLQGALMMSSSRLPDSSGLSVR